MHPRCSGNAVREKPGSAGSCGRPAGMPCARDKPAGAFVVSGKILVGCRTDVWMSDGRSDVGRTSERQTDGEDQHTLARNVEDVVGED